ncbi:hypothetical protein M595_1407 [Lyngbya aestuarii BL J]|uniref:Uncharacterized protein n=1 Tax=Lyngbya aestuarii BL J TaxID=1348334 RepID=U7QKX8_9CYAN|nr:hypothetical protein M595_1407 [Lyngbya aestuarii BL J]
MHLHDSKKISKISNFHIAICSFSSLILRVEMHSTPSEVNNSTPKRIFAVFQGQPQFR